MKTTLILLLITVTTFSGVPGEIEAIKTQQPTAKSLKAIVPTIEKKTDSLRTKYFEQIAIRDEVTDKLIEENARLKVEIRKLKTELKNNTVYIHDTVFKKRKLLQLFKN